MAENDIQSLGLVDFLKDALESTLLADADSVETLQDTIKDYSSDTLEFMVPDASGNDHVVKIPKLAIAPLPLLRIQEANFEVKGELEISQTNSQSQSIGRRARLRNSIKIIPASTTKTQEKKTSLNVTINVKMAQANIPEGLTNLLQIAANNLQVKDK